MDARDETTRIQLEQILRDSKRLDWLGSQQTVNVPGVFNWEYTTYGNSLRKAIDAAMEGAIAK
jgi:hypothetical protein